MVAGKSTWIVGLKRESKRWFSAVQLREMNIDQLCCCCTHRAAQVHAPAFFPGFFLSSHDKRASISCTKAGQDPAQILNPEQTTTTIRAALNVIGLHRQMMLEAMRTERKQTSVVPGGTAAAGAADKPEDAKMEGLDSTTPKKMCVSALDGYFEQQRMQTSWIP